MKKPETKNYNAEIEQLDERVRAERKTIASLEANLQRVLADKAEAEETRTACAYDALTREDGETLKGLDQAETVLAKAGQRLKSVEIALETAKRKLHDLGEQRQAAYRESKRRELDNEVAAVIAQEASKIETALAMLIEAKGAMAERIEKMDALASQAEIKQPRHRLFLKNVWRAIEQRVGLAPVYMDKRWRDLYRGQTVAQVLERVVKGNAEPPEQTQPAVNE